LLDAAGLNEVDGHSVPHPHRSLKEVEAIHLRLDKESGWLLAGPDEKLLLWIPLEYRDQLWWPGTKQVIGAPTIHLDLSKFQHGENWHKCYIGDETRAGSSRVGV